MERPKSRYTFYDPETYRILVEAGQPISPEVEQRLKELNFYETAVGVEEKIAYETAVEEKIAFGRKKGAWARVRLMAGTGKVIVNGKLAEEIFGWLSWQAILQPFQAAGLEASQWDVEGEVRGSIRGSYAQKRALQHAIAGAIVKFFPEKRKVLRQSGFCWRRR